MLVWKTVYLATAAVGILATSEPEPTPFHPPESCSSDIEIYGAPPEAAYWGKPNDPSSLIWSCVHLGQHNHWPDTNALKGWWTDHDQRFDALGREVSVYWPDNKYECGRCWDEDWVGNTYSWYNSVPLNEMDGVTMEWMVDSTMPGDGLDLPVETCKVSNRTICTRKTLEIPWNHHTKEDVEKAIAKGGKREVCEHVKVCYGSRSCCMKGQPL